MISLPLEENILAMWLSQRILNVSINCLSGYTASGKALILWLTNGFPKFSPMLVTHECTISTLVIKDEVIHEINKIYLTDIELWHF